MIQQTTHHGVTDGGDPAGYGLALAVALELTPPAARAPELAPSAARQARRPAGRRRTAAVRG
ncbi:hypothetical protein ACFV6E_10180 [Streptomyces sp. NPDC059785]|uniref:hypothetical protein n=1 Tax=unclassified Streptomyces TaxID=2593676 RepID=UPI00365C87B1